MSNSDQVDESNVTVEVDDRGRITIPKHVREQLGIRPGDELSAAIMERGLCLRPEGSELVTARTNKQEWGREMFPDSGEATFGGSHRMSDE